MVSVVILTLVTLDSGQCGYLNIGHAGQWVSVVMITLVTLDNGQCGYLNIGNTGQWSVWSS